MGFLKVFDRKDNRFFAVVFVITIITACLPLFSGNCINGDDIAYHLLRIEALKEGIKEGLPFLRVNVLYFGGEGYASSMFYPDLLLYIPALLRVMGVGINAAYHIFIGVCIILGFFSAFCSVKSITDSRYAALVSAVIFTLYQYHMDDIYERSAVGEFTAMIFVPLVIAGLYDMVSNSMKKPYILGIGMAGVLLCHTITTVFCAVLCFIFVIAAIKKIIREPVILLRLVITAAAVLLLTSFYWIPVLEQTCSAVLSYKNVYFDVDYEKILFRDIFRNACPGMGTAIFILLMPRLLIKEKNEKTGFADLCLITGILFTLCTTGLFPWARLSGILSFIQFPWRLFIMSGSLLAVAEGIYINEAFSKDRYSETVRKTVLIAVSGIMIVSAVGNINRNEQGYYSYSDDYFSYAPYTETVIGGEWLPETASDRDRLTNDAGIAYLDNGESIDVRRTKNMIDISDIPSGVKYIDVPFIYYKGYAAKDESGERLKTDGNGSDGRVRVYTGGSENIHVYYEGTALQHISDTVSILSLLGIIITAILVRRKKTIGKAE